MYVFISIVTACTTGTHCIGDAARMIEYGDADVMVAGGSEAAITELSVAGFASAKALSSRNDEPERASRPWDKGRDGFVLSEDEVIEFCREHMARFKAPKSIVFSDLPKTSTGKIQKFELRQRALAL